jgi:hypothetical protein
MKAESTIRKELRAAEIIWPQIQDVDDDYNYMRGVEFALAWVLSTNREDCRPTRVIREQP